MAPGYNRRLDLAAAAIRTERAHDAVEVGQHVLRDHSGAKLDRLHCWPVVDADLAVQCLPDEVLASAAA
jgi:hypothetical protein